MPKISLSRVQCEENKTVHDKDLHPVFGKRSIKPILHLRRQKPKNQIQGPSDKFESGLLQGN
jgi:hypothetical protein